MNGNPDAPAIPHICHEVLSSIGEVLAKNVRNDFIKDLKKNGNKVETPKHAHQRMLKSAVEKISDYPEEVFICFLCSFGVNCKKLRKIQALNCQITLP